MNHINIVAASLMHIHRNKHLKRNLYICTAVNNTGNKLSNRNLNENIIRNGTEPNSSPITEISVLWYGGDCDKVNNFSFKYGQQSDGCAAATD